MDDTEVLDRVVTLLLDAPDHTLSLTSIVADVHLKKVVAVLRTSGKLVVIMFVFVGFSISTIISMCVSQKSGCSFPNSHIGRRLQMVGFPPSQSGVLLSLLSRIRGLSQTQICRRRFRGEGERCHDEQIRPLFRRHDARYDDVHNDDDNGRVDGNEWVRFQPIHEELQQSTGCDDGKSVFIFIFVGLRVQNELH